MPGAPLTDLRDRAPRPFSSCRFYGADRVPSKGHGGDKLAHQ